MVAHEVHDRQDLTVRMQAKAAPQLLNEDGRRVGGPQKEDAVDDRDVDALVQDIRHKEPLQRVVWVRKVAVDGLALGDGHVAGDADGPVTAAVKGVGHESRVATAGAKAHGGSASAVVALVERVPEGEVHTSLDADGVL